MKNKNSKRISIDWSLFNLSNCNLLLNSNIVNDKIYYLRLFNEPIVL